MRGIARQVCVSKSFVRKIVQRYQDTNTSLQPTSQYIEVQRLMKPSVYGSEIKQRLLLDGALHPADIPSISEINKVSHFNHQMTRKKISVIPQKSTTHQVQQQRNDFLAEISTFRVDQIHFFDESGVTKTTGNRSYGSAVVGEPAIEIQRYASNANFTINLLHSCNGSDYYNILRGPSNGLELLLFFEEAIQLEHADGRAILERSDCVVMDNCGVEPILRDMLGQCGVRLIFQPVYSPYFNSCEYCFNSIKEYLRRNQLLAEYKTEIVIANGILEITQEQSLSIFRHIGFAD